MGATSCDGEERRVSDESHDSEARDRMTVTEAARLLGITEGAVRKRVERGKLEAAHMSDGRLLVYLDSDTTATDTTGDRQRASLSHDTRHSSDRYTRSLEDQVEYLRGQLDREREARTEERRRHDTLMAQLTQANAALAARIPELEAPASDAQESTEATESAEEPEGAQTTRAAAPAGPQTGTQRRPWWLRVFGR